MHWEKTVEYFFLWHCIRSNLVDFASPMSGKQERGAGDAIFGSYSKLLLIEFKSDASCLVAPEECSRACSSAAFALIRAC